MEIEATGFCPAPDEIIRNEALGPITAVVFGRVWRYCQMRGGVCTADQYRIATDLNMSRQTVNKHIDLLVQHGYIKDTTPDAKGVSHVYQDAGKFKMRLTVESTNPEPVKDIDRGCKRSLQGVSKVLTGGVKEVYSSKIEKETNKIESIQPPAAPAFSPAEKPEPEPKPKRARSPKQLEQDAEVKAVCEAFSETSGIPMPPKLFTDPSKRDINDWLAPAKSLIGTHNGRSVQAIIAAVTKHKAQRKNGEPLAIKNFYSVKWALPPLVEQTKPDTRRTSTQIIFEK